LNRSKTEGYKTVLRKVLARLCDITENSLVGVEGKTVAHNLYSADAEGIFVKGLDLYGGEGFLFLSNPFRKGLRQALWTRIYISFFKCKRKSLPAFHTFATSIFKNEVT
jgi:hypothetical protein